jgi:hypothetical protein
MMTETYTRSIAEMQQLTQEYASFSQSRSGLGNVLGGVAGLLAVAAMWLFGPGVAAAVLTVGGTVAWLVGKEIIRARLYRPFGDAREIWPASQRREHLVAVALVAVVLAAFAVLIGLHLLFATPAWSKGLPYLAFCLVTPLIAWRYLRTITELMVGVFLLFACAISAAGFMPDRVLFTAILPAYSILLIGVGLKEHRQFQALAVRLRARHGDGA